MSKRSTPAIEQRLENLEVPEINTLQHQRQLKLTILNAKRSSAISLWLLFIPFIVLLGGLLQSVFHIMVPPWSWLVKFSPLMPVWLRVFIFAIVLIILPGIAVIVNISTILWFKYDKTGHTLYIALRMRRQNVIVIIVAAILAFLFIGHTITEWITRS